LLSFIRSSANDKFKGAAGSVDWRSEEMCLAKNKRLFVTFKL
jgi:hypothetical protein